MKLDLNKEWTEKYEGQTEIMLEDNIFVIPYYAFEYNNELRFIALPETISKISKSAFKQCKSLEKVVMPKTIDTIGNGAFFECVNLKEIELPSGMTEICNSTFFGCKSLEYIRIPEGVTRIGKNAFADCISLKRIYLPKSLEVIDDYAFQNCVNLTTVEGGDSVRIIGDLAFGGCANLEKFDLGSSVEMICDSSFLDSSFKIPESILTHLDDEYISGNVAFVPDGTLTITEQALLKTDGIPWDEVVLPDSVRNISAEAFYSMFSFKITLNSPEEDIIASLPKKMNMPENYFKQKTAFDVKMAFILANTLWENYVIDEDYEYMLLYQNSKEAQNIACDFLSESCGYYLNHMMKITDNSPQQLENLAAYAATYLQKIELSDLEALKIRAKNNNAYKALEFLEKYCFAHLENTDDEISEFCLRNFSPYAAERYFPDDSNLKNLLNSVKYRESDKYVPDYVVKCVLAAYMQQIPKNKDEFEAFERFRIVNEAEYIVSEFDYESFLNVIKELPLEYVHMFVPVCRYGDADSVDKICEEIITAESFNSAYRLNFAKKALELNESDEAQALLEGLRYAESCDDDFDEDDSETENPYDDYEDDYEDDEEVYLL
ncbi:MAG: leucine-rich repeat domain-containing protein [Ruminococcus sp.]